MQRSSRRRHAAKGTKRATGWGPQHNGQRVALATVATAFALFVVYLAVSGPAGQRPGEKGKGTAAGPWTNDMVRLVAELDTLENLMDSHARPLLVPRPVGSRNHARARKVWLAVFHNPVLAAMDLHNPCRPGAMARCSSLISAGATRSSSRLILSPWAGR